MESKRRFTQQGDCDPADPEEHFLWALTQIQMGQYEVMPIQPNTARTISKHLHELGFRHHPKLQKKKLQMPVRGQQSAYNGLARWVPMEADEPDPMVLPDVRGMTSEEREWITQELKDVGHITDPPPDIGPVARVTSWEDLQVLSQRVTTAEAVLRDDSA
jgi:hypothetical protein